MSKAAIIAAAKELDLKATRRLLAERPELLAAVDRSGQNLLHLACAAAPEKHGTTGAAQTRYVRFLLGHGLAIDTPVGRDACTPLFFAVARARNFHLVKELIDRGADVNAAPGGGLFAAGWWGDVPILKLLIRAGGLARHGASPEIEDGTGASALERASRKRDKRYLSALSLSG